MKCRGKVVILISGGNIGDRISLKVVTPKNTNIK